MVKKELLEWTLNYLKSRDAIRKEIVSMDTGKDEVEVTYKDKKKIFRMVPELDEQKVLENHVMVITLNTKKNFDWLISKWNKIATYDDLSIYFINLKLDTDNRWIITPFIHNKVVDKDNFRQSMKTLFESVPEYK